jgi:hypothetical protein
MQAALCSCSLLMSACWRCRRDDARGSLRPGERGGQAVYERFALVGREKVVQTYYFVVITLHGVRARVQRQSWRERGRERGIAWL